MAFPMPNQKEKDPHFLLPYDPSGFERRHPPRPRHFLFRIDNRLDGDRQRAVILVQSDLQPDWDYGFHNADMFLAAKPERRELDPKFHNGQEFRFRVRVNLSKRSKTHRNRVAVTWKSEAGEKPDEAIHEWFADKGRHYGFELTDFDLIHLGWVTGWRPKKRDDPTEHRLRFRSALLEGTLKVAHAEKFSNEAISTGIGHAKAFGFGLLSLAPLARSPDAP
jgi:CRISPR system Cascade subunit CasE